MTSARLWIRSLAMGLALMLVADVAAARGYISSKGHFYIWYPDDWAQVDYNTVDYYLMNSNASEEAYNYDAVFAPAASAPFYSGDYLIVSVDTLGELSSKQIDSVVNDYSLIFGEGVKYLPTGDFMTDIKSRSPNYDRDNKLLTILSDVTEQNKVVKKNLSILKFYNRGIAYFYFYSPDSLFQQSKPLFEKIVNSFSTENLNAALPREELKLAKIREEGGAAGLRWFWPILIIIAVIAAVIIVVTAARKRGIKTDSERKGP